MTEPQGGADPKVFKTKAELKGDNWVINGQKWFSSNAHLASFLIVMAVTDPDAPEYKRMSMFIVPSETPGVKILKNLAVGTHEGEGSHGYMQYTDVIVPKDHMLGPRGGAFAVAQTRLGGGRIHHAMRTIGQVRRDFMMCERALSRSPRVRGSPTSRWCRKNSPNSGWKSSNSVFWCCAPRGRSIATKTI